jgi:phosphoglycolate phosphatase-like HAD superfamily hydrolase
MKEKHSIIFDFDGVIIDSFDITYEVLLPDNPGLTKDQLRKAFEMHFYDAVNKNTCVLDNYQEAFTKRIDDVALFDGVPQLLDELAQKYDLHIVSSNFEDIIEYIIQRENIDAYFDSVLGWNTSHYKSEKFKTIFNERTPDEFIFVTDTAGDIGEAHQVQLPAIGYTQGFHSRTTLEKAQPHAIIDALSMVKNYL